MSLAHGHLVKRPTVFSKFFSNKLHALQGSPVSVSKRCFVYICYCVLKFYQAKHPWFYQGSFICQME